MPAYHTTQVQQMPSVGNMGVLALRGNTKGPAPQIQEEDIIGNKTILDRTRKNQDLLKNQDQRDFLDEAIKYFKANVFFKSFSPENDADRLFIYVTLWIQGRFHIIHRVY